MKHFFCCLFTMLICSSAFCISIQPAQQNAKSKATDTTAAKNTPQKIQPAAAAPDNKQKIKKDPPAEDKELLVPLSWRPVPLY